MIPELGHFSLILALCFSVLLAVVPGIGVKVNDPRWMGASRLLSAGQFLFIAIAYTCLTLAFARDDFTVAIVAAQSNTQLPMAYKISAVWGGHEGSLLLWVFILAGWTVAVSLFSRRLPLDILARVMAVMGMIAIGFLGFSLLTSNPFERLLVNPPMDGQDLNPLLQDPGMVIHPPMLYFGYVGFSVAFAFALAALASGRLDASWARWSRPWTNVAWAFLTVGITLGSWWAYYELGWGGWWFWDPVENASFMPWLVGTALIHSLAVTEKRGVFKSWTVLLAIFAFSLSLLGTFLVRSGVLTSVHAFAADPERGLFILAFLFIVVGGSLTLYAFKAPAVVRRSAYKALAREGLLLANNVILVVAALTVLVGTLFPLVMDFLGAGKYSVGPPYFNAMFIPMMAVLAALTGLGPSSQWKRTRGQLLVAQLAVALVASLVLAVLLPALGPERFNLSVSVATLLFFWIVLSSMRNLQAKLRNASSSWAGLRRLTPSYYGMLLAHLGFAVSLLGVVVTSQYSEERDLRLAVGESVSLQSGYQLRFADVGPVTGPNYRGQQGRFELYRDQQLITELYPEKRRYHARGSQVMTEAGIDAGFWRDVYVAMGEVVGDDAWAVRVHYKPFVRWIWLGGVFMALGGVLAISDKRYRLSTGSGASAKTGRAAA